MGNSGGGGGGGGGAGYYGGGGGDYQSGDGGSAGGGGSSYVNTSYLITPEITFSSGLMMSSSPWRTAVVAPYSGDAEYIADGSVAGKGGQGGASTISGLAGGRGLVALTFY